MIGVLYPALLGLIPFFGGYLFWVYLKRGSGQELLVPSVFILRRITAIASARKRIRLPLRLLVELILGLLLIGILAGVYLQKRGEEVFLLIDNSPSMGAKEFDHTLLEQAKEVAIGAVAELSSSSRIRIYVTSPHLKPISDETIDPSEVRGLLSAVTIGFGADNLEQALTTFPEDRQVIVVTDRVRKAGGARSVRFLKVIDDTKQLDNVAITDLRVGADLGVEVTSFGHLPVDGTISLRVVESPINREQLVTEKTFHLLPHESKAISFGTARTGPLQIELGINQAGIRAGANALSSDDFAYVSMDTSRKTLVVVTDRPKTGLDSLPGLSVRTISTSGAIDGLTQSITDDAAAIIFDGVAPQALPKRPALFILPPESGGVVSSRSEDAGSITTWGKAQALLRYVNVEGLELGPASPLDTPEWASGIIGAARGDLLWAGERDGLEFVGTGFELLPFVGANNTGLSVLTLNILRFLTQGGFAGGFVVLPKLVQLDRDDIAIMSLNNEEIWRQGEGEPTIDAPGLVIIKKSDGRQRFAALDFFSAGESDLSGRQPVIVAEGQSKKAAEQYDASLRQNLLATLVLLLLADMFFLAWKYRRRMA